MQNIRGSELLEGGLAQKWHVYSHHPMTDHKLRSREGCGIYNLHLPYELTKAHWHSEGCDRLHSICSVGLTICNTSCVQQLEFCKLQQ